MTKQRDSKPVAAPLDWEGLMRDAAKLYENYLELANLGGLGRPVIVATPAELNSAPPLGLVIWEQQ